MLDKDKIVKGVMEGLGYEYKSKNDFDKEQFLRKIGYEDPDPESERERKRKALQKRSEDILRARGWRKDESSIRILNPRDYPLPDIPFMVMKVDTVCRRGVVNYQITLFGREMK